MNLVTFTCLVLRAAGLTRLLSLINLVPGLTHGNGTPVVVELLLENLSPVRLMKLLMSPLMLASLATLLLLFLGDVNGCVDAPLLGNVSSLPARS